MHQHSSNIAITAESLRTLSYLETRHILDRSDEPTLRTNPVRKIVLIDMDGVLADSLPNWLEAYNLLSGEDIEAEDIKSYGFGEYVRQPELLFSCLERAMVFLNAQPMPGAIEGFRRLYKAHDVYVVTYNHEACRNGHAQKLAWMRKYLPEFPSNRVIFTKYKAMVHGDVLIEDAPDNISTWLTAHPHGQAFCINHNYNSAFSLPGAKHVSSINEVSL